MKGLALGSRTITGRSTTSSDTPLFVAPRLHALLGSFVDLPKETEHDAAAVEESYRLFKAYSNELKYICETCAITRRRDLTEEEVFAGTIAAKASQPRYRKDQMGSSNMHSKCLLVETVSTANMRRYSSAVRLAFCAPR